MGAAFWAILNTLLSPIFWQVTHMPFLCDLLAFTSLIVVTWLTRKFGSATLTGIIASILTLIIRPAAFHMLGFIAASIVFDVLNKAIGYSNCFNKNRIVGSFILVLTSVFSGAIAGGIIGIFFMSFEALVGIIIFSGLHAFGGLLGGLLGVILVRALEIRNVTPLINEEKL